MLYTLLIIAGLVLGIIIQHAVPSTYEYLSKLWRWLVNLVKAVIVKFKKD